MNQNQAAAPAANVERIRQILGDFAWFADRGDGERLAQLFVADGVLHVGGQELVGREQIAQDCLRRAAIPGRKTRHVWSNLRIERVEAGSISSTVVQLTFEQVDQQESGSQQLRISDVFDTFVQDSAGQWRIASRLIQRAMGLTL
ncbi:nuclear transport factor 2 family protein [Ramlibacter sp.]|uniref:nuclear transport factor 2 family protein n=1 Tax=Ramlibacter sp. TaxID=1917967 RepID=UPI0026379ACD|nr:nuclear transport factor 2 family protein [Ramlibacter sp.]MDB5954540.1 ring hydroxylating beta subunit [Ramlibacter sp.]